MVDFSYEGTDHLGLIKETVSTLDSLILLEDSSVVVIRTQKILTNGTMQHLTRQVDTVADFPLFQYPNLTYENMEAMFGKETVFVGFDREEMNRRAAEVPVIINPYEPIEPEPMPISVAKPDSVWQADSILDNKTIMVDTVVAPYAVPDLPPVDSNKITSEAIEKAQKHPKQEKNRQNQNQEGNGLVIALVAFFLFIYGLFRTTIKPAQHEN